MALLGRGTVGGGTTRISTGPKFGRGGYKERGFELGVQEQGYNEDFELGVQRRGF